MPLACARTPIAEELESSAHWFWTFNLPSVIGNQSSHEFGSASGGQIRFFSASFSNRASTRAIEGRSGRTEPRAQSES